MPIRRYFDKRFDHTNRPTQRKRPKVIRFPLHLYKLAKERRKPMPVDVQLHKLFSTKKGNFSEDDWVLMCRWMSRDPERFAKGLGQDTALFAQLISEMVIINSIPSAKHQQIKGAESIGYLLDEVGTEAFARGLDVHAREFARGLSDDVYLLGRGLGANAEAFARGLDVHAREFACGMGASAEVFAKGLGVWASSFARGLGEHKAEFAADLHEYRVSPKIIEQLTRVHTSHQFTSANEKSPSRIQRIGSKLRIVPKDKDKKDE